MTFMNTMERFASVRSRLQAEGLWNSCTLVMLGSGENRTVLDANGDFVRTELFSSVSAPMAVFTSGPFSGKYILRPRPLRASTDDAAQMFGPFVPCARKPHAFMPAALLPNRGCVVTGRFENELIAACILLEKMCEQALFAPSVGGLVPLGMPLCIREHSVYVRKYSRPSLKAAEGFSPDAGNSDTPDRALREAVIVFGKKLAEHRLIQATWGNVSVRIDADRFLITPSGVDYGIIRPEDIVEVRVSDGSFPDGARPSSERKMHRLIYAMRPDAGAVIHTHSSALQVFAACRMPLHTSEQTIPCSAYGVNGSETLAKNTAAVLRAHDCCIMANHGFTAVAADLETALSKALSAEAAAKNALTKYM